MRKETLLLMYVVKENILKSNFLAITEGETGVEWSLSLNFRLLSKIALKWLRQIIAKGMIR
jgi:hypothetical protein